MIDMVIVNPSANMRKIATEIEQRGYKTAFVRTTDIPYFFPEKVYYFFQDYNIYFSAQPQGTVEKDDGVFLFKNSLISRIRLGSVEKKLNHLNHGLTGGYYNDYIMFRRGVLEYAVAPSHETFVEYPDITAVCKEYGSSVVATSLAVGHSSIKMVTWQTDYDLAETFGRDYFVLFTKEGRLDAFFYENSLYTIGKAKNHIEALAGFNKSIRKFSFEKVLEKGLITNYNPWIMENSTPGYFLVNDYGFSMNAVSMPAAWYDKCASFICMNGAFVKLLKKGS